MPSVTVSVYTLAVAGEAVVLAIVVDANAAPLHIYVVVAPAPFAVRSTKPPRHIGPSLTGAAIGVGVMVITVGTKQPPGRVYVMIEVPAPVPVTNPDERMTAFTLLVVHSPPLTASDSVKEPPTHTVPAPLIGPGDGFTVTTAILTQFELNVYVIVLVPVDMPVTKPLVEPIVTLPLLLLQVPPPIESVNVIFEPIHIGRLPFIAPGNASIETIVVEKQPVGRL